MTRDSFLGRFDPMARAAVRPGAWRPAPPIDDRDAWAHLPPSVVASLCAEADRRRDQAAAAAPSLALWVHYGETGERLPYERAHQALLGETASSALAWAATGDDGWGPRLADAVWRLCELSAWCLPNHYALPETGERPLLPQPGRDILDLACAATGGMLAAVDAIAGAALDRRFPGIRDRVRHEIRRRVLDPWERETYFWHGVDAPPNNWAPWIVSNVLACAAAVEDDRDRLERAVERALAILDRFRDGYAPDGSCDEGATYWWWAGATLFEALEVVEHLTGGVFQGYGVPPVAEMCRFPLRMQIDAERQVNFSDGSAVHPENAVWHLLARFGARIDDDAVVRHARWMGRAHPLGFGGQLAPLFLRTLAALRDPGWEQAGPAEPGMPASWFAPSTEIAVARERGHDVSGFAIAAKGGHNDVSHNHNDAGGVIVSLDGRPVLIDVGVGAYRRATFEPATRYTIWTMRSGWHGVPLPDGVEQREGAGFRAADVVFSDDGVRAALSMDLAPAYPAESGLLRCTRAVSLDRTAREVVVDDAWEFADARRMTLVLMTAVEPVADEHGLVVGPARLVFPADGLDVVVHRIPVDDERLSEAWGDAVFRVLLAPREPARAGALRIAIRPVETRTP